MCIRDSVCTALGKQKGNCQKRNKIRFQVFVKNYHLLHRTTHTVAYLVIKIGYTVKYGNAVRINICMGREIVKCICLFNTFSSIKRDNNFKYY